MVNHVLAISYIFVDRKILNGKFKKSYAIFDGFKYDSKNVNPGRAYFFV